jgi:hypothetical protein
MAFEVCETPDGGFAAVGRYGGEGSQPGMLIWLLKTDSLGDTMWTRVFGHGPGEQAYAEALVQTRDGGFLIPGQWGHSKDDTHDVFLIRTNAMGETLWTRPGPGPGGGPRDIKLTRDGGFIVMGYDVPDTIGHIYAARCDSLGNLLWLTYDHGIRGAWAYGVQQTADGGFIIAGTTSNPGHGYWGYLLRLDSLGDTLWRRPLHVGDDCYLYEVEVLPDGGFATAGTIGVGNDGFACLIRTDSLGETLWTRRYAGTADCVSLDLCSDGGFILGGTCSSGLTGCDVWILKASASGDSEWARSLLNTHDEYAEVVRQTSDGGYIAAGYIFISTSTANDFYLVKTDADGFAALQESPVRRVEGSEPSVVVRVPGRVLCFLPTGGISGLELFDIVGRRVAVLENRRQEAGWHEVELKGKLQAGAYFARLETNGTQAVAKFVVPMASSN